MGGGGAVRLPPVVFCPLLKKSPGNAYLKILNFSKLFIADAPMKKKIPKFSFTLVQRTKVFYLNLKIFLQTLVEIIFRYHYIFC